MIKRVTELDEVEITESKIKVLQTEIIKIYFWEIEVDKLGYTAYSFSGEEIQSYSFIGIAEALVGKCLIIN